MNKVLYLECEGALLTVEPVVARSGEKAGQVLFTNLNITTPAGKFKVTDGGWDLTGVPEWVPCRVKLAVVPREKNFAYTFSLDRNIQPFIEPMGAKSKEG